MRSRDPAAEFSDMAGKAMSVEWLVENAPAVFAPHCHRTNLFYYMYCIPGYYTFPTPFFFDFHLANGPLFVYRVHRVLHILAPSIRFCFGFVSGYLSTPYFCSIPIIDTYLMFCVHICKIT